MPFLGFFPVEIQDFDVGLSHHHQLLCCSWSSFASLLHHAKVEYPLENHGTVDVIQPSLFSGLCFHHVIHTTAVIESANARKEEVNFNRNMQIIMTVGLFKEDSNMANL